MAERKERSTRRDDLYTLRREVVALRKSVRDLRASLAHWQEVARLRETQVRNLHDASRIAWRSAIFG